MKANKFKGLGTHAFLFLPSAQCCMCKCSLLRVQMHTGTQGINSARILFDFSKYTTWPPTLAAQRHWTCGSSRPSSQQVAPGRAKTLLTKALPYGTASWKSALCQGLSRVGGGRSFTPEVISTELWRALEWKVLNVVSVDIYPNHT